MISFPLCSLRLIHILCPPPLAGEDEGRGEVIVLFVGSPVLSSSQPLVALVDQYVPPDLSHVYLPLVLH